MNLSREQLGSNEPLLPQLDMGELKDAGEQPASGPPVAVAVIDFTLSVLSLPVALSAMLLSGRNALGG